MKAKLLYHRLPASTLWLTAVFAALTVPVVDAADYDPNTAVYIDALWFRAHAADCPTLILKEHKATMTLAEADRAGARIGESGQSGRTNCCFVGYQRQHPQAEIAEDALGVVQLMKSGRNKYHVHGCHRFTPNKQDRRMTLANARSEPGFYLCIHCEERGPGYAQMSDAEWAKLPSTVPWGPPAGWAPSPFPTDGLPAQEEIDILLSQTLHGDDLGILDRVFINPVATVDNFVIMRFFFPVGRWLELYQAYRSTGDAALLEQLRGSARHYNSLSKNYLSAAQKKARDPEGMAYLYTMAASARITLQLARKYPAQVTASELAEAEDFLMTIVSVLQPACEGNDNLDPQMGIPRPLADDFRNRAFNRALNGIGTIGMATAALEDLQALNGYAAYQSTIDRYRKVIEAYIKNWKSTGFEETVDGEDYFSYPYSASDSGYMVGDVKLFAADDQGHFSHSLQGVMCLYESVPELGVDDTFMAAIANTIHFNSYTNSGSPQTPSQEAIRPYSRKSFGAPRDRFYMLEAFKDGVIDGQCSKLSASQKESVNREYAKRLKTLHAQYLKALRLDRTRIHLAEKDATAPAAPTGLTAAAGDGSVTLDWDDNGESDVRSYNVYRATASNAYTATLVTGLSASTYVDTTVANDTTYFYVVTAEDSSGNESAESAEVHAMPVVLPLVSILSPADGASYSSPAELTVDVSASYSEDSITKVELWRNGILEATDAVAPYNFSLAGLSGGTHTLEARAYHNQLSASDKLQISVWKNEPPSGLTARGGDGVISLDWNDNPGGGLARYNVYRSTNPGSYGTALATGLPSSQFTDSSVDNDITYYYAITATDMNDVESAQSAEVSATPNVFSGNSIVFGYGFDGFGEFTQSTPVAGQIWSLEQGSVRYRNQSTNLENASLLREFPLDRTDGNIFTFEGVVHLTEGYADDNARVGLYLFGDSPVVPNEDETGALCLLINLDQGSVRLMEGIDKNTISVSDTGRRVDNSIFGNTVKFAATITFSGSEIEITGDFIDEFGAMTSVNAIVSAASYTGDYFGFATRTRSRNYGVSGDPKSAAFMADYESFKLSWDNEPLGGYQQWAKDWGLAAPAAEAGDYDMDGVSNLVEFALGGNPNDPSDRGTLPTFSRSFDSALFVYPRRNDTEELIYTVETNTTLSPDSWTATRYTVGDTEFGDGAHDFVTIHVDTDEPNLFIRLRITSRSAE